MCACAWGRDLMAFVSSQQCNIRNMMSLRVSFRALLHYRVWCMLQIHFPLESLYQMMESSSFCSWCKKKVKGYRCKKASLFQVSDVNMFGDSWEVDWEDCKEPSPPPFDPCLNDRKALNEAKDACYGLKDPYGKTSSCCLGRGNIMYFFFCKINPSK